MDERSEQVREEFMDIATADMGINWSDEHIGYTIKKMADEIVRWRTLDNERKARRAAREPIHSLYDILVQLSEENDDLIEERNRLRGALATVSGERDALVNLVEVLRQYYQMEATDDELYAAFCAWRENPFTGKASA